MRNVVERLLINHWPEYVMEAAELSAFMISAALVTALVGEVTSRSRQSRDTPSVGRGPAFKRFRVVHTCPS
jgi:hypothetical protein